jgi:hypothetical protein
MRLCNRDVGTQEAGAVSEFNNNKTWNDNETREAIDMVSWLSCEDPKIRLHWIHDHQSPLTRRGEEVRCVGFMTPHANRKLYAAGNYFCSSGVVIGMFALLQRHFATQNSIVQKWTLGQYFKTSGCGEWWGMVYVTLMSILWCHTFFYKHVITKIL